MDLYSDCRKNWKDCGRGEASINSINSLTCEYLWNLQVLFVGFIDNPWLQRLSCVGRFPSYQKEQCRRVGRQVSYSGLLLFTDSGWWQSDLVENHCTIQLLSRLMRLFKTRVRRMTWARIRSIGASRGAPAHTSPQTQRQIQMKRESDIKNTKPQACHNRGRTASALGRQFSH